MTHDHHGSSIFINLIAKNLTDIPSGLSVQRCRGFIGKKNRRIPRKGSCHCDSLPLSRTELIRLLMGFITQAEFVEEFLRHFQSLRLLRVAKFETKRNVVDRRE